jgi:predicted dehydrogenase
MGNAHERAIKHLADRVDVVATVDPALDKAKRAAKTVGASTAVRDYHEIIDEVDAVVLSLPHQLHYQIGADCLAHGKHVLMEKPLANTEAECVSLIAAAEQSGLTLMTAYPLRFHPLVIRMKEMIDAGALGDVFQMSIWTEQLTNRGGDKGWMLTKADLGGGQFFSHGCHYVDLMLWMLGQPIRGYHAGSHLGTEWMEGEGSSNVVVEFASGAVAYHFGTWGARGTKLGNSFHVHGTEGMLDLDRNAGTLKLYAGGEVRDIDHAEPKTKNLQGEIGHFLDCIESGAKPMTDGWSSLQGLRVIWRLYAAEEVGAVADLHDLSLDSSRT